MKILTGLSSASNVDVAVSQVIENFKTPELIIFFAPVSKFKAVAEKFKNLFSDTTVLGTTSHYMFSNNGISENTICAISFEEGIQFGSGVIEEIKRYPLKYAPVVKEQLNKVPKENTICMEFTTALSMSEELVLALYDTVCAPDSIPVFGGSSGMSETEFENKEKSFVSYNGKVYDEASIFVFIHNQKGKIEIFKQNIYKKSSDFFRVTDVDIKNRIVKELDGKPAAEVLAAEIPCVKEELPYYLQIYPVGRVMANGFYISDLNKVLPDGSVSWNSRIYNETRICLVEPDDYKKITNDTIKKVHEKIKDPSFVFMINCLALTVYYKKINYLSEFSDLMGKSFKYFAGFSSTGEQLNDMHLNQTMIMAVFE